MAVWVAVSDVDTSLPPFRSGIGSGAGGGWLATGGSGAESDPEPPPPPQADIKNIAKSKKGALQIVIPKDQKLIG